MVHRDGRTPSQRQLRVGEQVRHALSNILLRGDLRDPDLVRTSITVTEVRLSPDLRNATAFVLPLGGADSDKVVAALQRAAPFLRGEVARAVKLRFAPGLRFTIDTSFDEAGKIDSLLRDVEAESADHASDDDETEGAAPAGADDRHGA